MTMTEDESTKTAQPPSGGAAAQPYLASGAFVDSAHPAVIAYATR